LDAGVVAWRDYNAELAIIRIKTRDLQEREAINELMREADRVIDESRKETECEDASDFKLGAQTI
jgi:hypothetical protein